VFAFGDARYFGGMGGRRLDQPVVAMAPTPTGRGYWLVAADGGIFAFGDAHYFGSMGGRSLDQPVATIGATASGRGYWLLGRDGGVFAFGDAPFLGAATPAASLAVGIVRSATGRGYWIAHADDRVDAFGDASPVAAHIVRAPVVGIATPWASSSGYALVLIEELRRPLRTWPAAREVALTFDDGPSAYTQQVVDTLRRYGVTATFFAVGYQLAARASAVRAAVAAGDAVEVHSWHHPQLTRLDATEIAAELRATADEIHSLTGERPRCFRPPYGDTNATVVAVGRSLGLTQVLWNVDPSDYLRPGASVIASRVVAAATGRGLVVGIHDGGGDRSQTVAALPAIITGLRAHGYRFVRLCG
jgi:peptidoglycan/xylan/chitin deacetylase (PgdA/CDA1 family)